MLRPLALGLVLVHLTVTVARADTVDGGTPAPASADGGAPPEEPKDPALATPKQPAPLDAAPKPVLGRTGLTYRPSVDVPITGIGAVGWLLTELFESSFARKTCKWCESKNGAIAVNGLDGSVRSSLKWKDFESAATISNLTGFVLTPLATLGVNAFAATRNHKNYQLLVDGLLVAEATVVAVDITQLVKFTVGRERPFVAALPDAQKLLTKTPADNNASFFSGHTSFTFAVAVSAGMVAHYRGYSWEPWIWIGGLTMATATGYLRIAGDRHFFTDVLSGAVVGSAVGFGIPWLHRVQGGALPPVVTVQKTADASVVGLSWAY